MQAEALAHEVQQRLATLADPSKAARMATYMKTKQPFYGVQRPAIQTILRDLKPRFSPNDRSEYEQGVLALWSLPHREERYAAIDFALLWKHFITPASLPLFEQLVREGAWWDLVDPVAAHLVGRLLLDHRAIVRPAVERFVDDDQLWIRRTALLAHLRHKNDTDAAQLFDHCRRRAFEKEFFIRKAIGWALREYSKTAPAKVRDFLLDNRSLLSGLSFREGAKWLKRQGTMADSHM